MFVGRGEERSGEMKINCRRGGWERELRDLGVAFLKGGGHARRWEAQNGKGGRQGETKRKAEGKIRKGEQKGRGWGSGKRENKNR